MSPSPGPDADSPSPDSRTPLVGRSQEQTLLREALEDALQGRGQLVLLGGEAGIGKTALARQLAREAEDAGARVIAGYCHDLTNTPPFGPWLELIRTLHDEQGMPTIPDAFRDGRVARVTDQSALFADVEQFISGLAAISPVFLLLEDLHWSDPASIELLRHVALTLRGVSALLVVTYRKDELTRHHPLFQYLPTLVREGGVRLEPRRLDTDAFHALVSARYQLHLDDEDRLVAYLERHSDGNPLFAVELMRTLEEEALITIDNGETILSELDRLVVPTLLSQVIEGRLSRLVDDIRQPLAIAAVIGHDVPLAMWAEIAEIDEQTMLTIVEQLVGAHLMEADRDGLRVHFDHALTREAIYDGILPPRRRALHQKVGEWLAMDAGADPDVVALHLQQAGDPHAWEWLVRAADRAQRVYAWLTASERLRAAATLLKGVEGQERTYTELLFRIAYLLRFSDPTASLQALDEVADLVRDSGEVVLAAEIQHVKGIHLCYAGQFELGIAQMLKSLQLLEAMPLDSARVSNAILAWFSAARSTTDRMDIAEHDRPVVERLYDAGIDFRRCTYLWHLASVGQSDMAITIADELVDLLTDAEGAREGIRIALAFAYYGLGISFAAVGRVDEAKEAWRQSREVFNIVDHHALIAFTQLHELQDLALTYDAAEPTSRRKLASEAEASLAQAGGALQPGLSPRLAWLWCLLLDGRWQDADNILQDLPDPMNAYLRRPVRTAIARLAYERGNPERAWKQIHAALPDGPATRPGNMIHQEGLCLQRLAFDLCLDAGELSAARSWLEAHDDWLDWSGSVLGRAEGHLAWARWYRAAGESDQARTRANDALDLGSAPDHPLVRLASHRLLGEILTAIMEFTDAALHLQKALDLERACEVPYERALTILALADLHFVTGDRDAALSLLEEARTILVQLGATPAVARADDLLARMSPPATVTTQPAGLTTREVEVLRLLVAHRTDKEIAEALFISHHTASTHVKHLLNKLGVANRRDAALYAVEHHIA